MKDLDRAMFWLPTVMGRVALGLATVLAIIIGPALAAGALWLLF
jgi:hypothetical protein